MVHAEMIEELVFTFLHMVINCILIFFADCVEVNVGVSNLFILRH